MTLLRLIRFILISALLATPAMAQPVSLDGTVSYRERIALPPGAQLTVTLVTLPDGHPVVGASASIPAKGQPPLAFTLNLRSNVARSGGAFGLMAEIATPSGPYFRSPEPYPIEIGTGAPAHIIVNAVPAPPPIIDPPVPTAPAALLETVWTVTSIGGRPAIGTRPVTLSIAADHRAGGNGGCNNYFTEATFEGAGLVFGPTAATRMACAPEIMAQEAAYFAALSAVASFELGNTSLRLLDAAGVPLVGLVRNEE